MRYPEMQAKLGLPLKRAILLYGTYGVGKSLAGLLTAAEAVANGWTFLMARPGRDDFLQVMQTARLYQPACVFFEDAENMAGADSNDQISQILDVFDGVDAKGLHLMVILTTNHPELIHKGMHRPGRVDSQIEIGALDYEGVEKLIRALIPADIMDEHVNFGEVCAAFNGFVPAFVREAAERAVRYSLVRSGGALAEIGTEDLINAANGLRPQFERMQGAPESTTSEMTLRQVVESAVQTGVAIVAANADDVRPDVWNPESLKAAQANHQ